MKTSYPTGFSPTGAYYSTGGKFYRIYPEGYYKQVECYLPAATGMYSEPFEDTMNKFFIDLEDGSKGMRLSTEAKGIRLMLVDNKLIRVSSTTA